MESSTSFAGAKAPEDLQAAGVLSVKLGVVLATGASAARRKQPSPS